MPVLLWNSRHESSQAIFNHQTRSLTQCSTILDIFHTECVSHLYRLLGKNIARFRREAKLTQEKLAEKTDYSVDFIGLVERGINAPTVARLKDIADAVGVDVWKLFYPQDQKVPFANSCHTRRRATGKHAQ
jgi:DNA-binding XRE family transcriptional regulator